MKERAKLKSSISRLVCILFPELEKLVSSLHLATVYALLEEFPGSKQIAKAHLTRLKTLLGNASKGRYGRDMAVTIRSAAQNLLGPVCLPNPWNCNIPSAYRELDAEIAEIEAEIETMMDKIQSPLQLSLAWLSYGCHDSC